MKMYVLHWKKKLHYGNRKTFEGKGDLDAACGTIGNKS